jgi:type IV secretory pathway VirB4 component
MLCLDKVIKPWKESAALNDHINLYGFWNETAFLTKSGDVGMILSVPGVDYESLDRSEQEYAVKRLEAALKAFGPGFHVYQYLFKSNRPDIPFATYDDPIVEAASRHVSMRQRPTRRRSSCSDSRVSQNAQCLKCRRLLAEDDLDSLLRGQESMQT